MSKLSARRVDSEFTDREQFLLVSSLRQRAGLEANMHYGGKLDGIAAELTALADKLDTSTEEDLLA